MDSPSRLRTLRREATLHHLNASTAYFVQLVAVNSAGESEPSAFVANSPVVTGTPARVSPPQSVPSQ